MNADNEGCDPILLRHHLPLCIFCLKPGLNRDTPTTLEAEWHLGGISSVLFYVYVRGH